MPKPCPDCGDGMVPADEMNCSKANWVCENCAPDFVLEDASSFTQP